MPEVSKQYEHPPASRLCPRLTTWQQATLSVYWFSTQALWCSILVALLPLQAEYIGGAEHKGKMLAIILPAGAFISLLAAPVFGAWSDRVRTRWGRRKPFLVIGTLLNALSLLFIASIKATPSALIAYAIAFSLITLTNNIATAPYSALIPDVVPPEQRGSASGWMGFMSMLGTLLGAATGLLVGSHPGPDCDRVCAVSITVNSGHVGDGVDRA